MPTRMVDHDHNGSSIIDSGRVERNSPTAKIASAARCSPMPNRARLLTSCWLATTCMEGGGGRWVAAIIRARDTRCQKGVSGSGDRDASGARDELADAGSVGDALGVECGQHGIRDVGCDGDEQPA